jgi:hypothetical protein
MAVGPASPLTAQSLRAVFVTLFLFPRPTNGRVRSQPNSRRLTSRHFRGINDFPYGLPLIYSTITCDAAPSVRLFLLSLSPPPRGSLKTKEAHHDDEDSQ